MIVLIKRDIETKKRFIPNTFDIMVNSPYIFMVYFNEIVHLHDDVYRNIEELSYIILGEENNILVTYKAPEDFKNSFKGEDELYNYILEYFKLPKEEEEDV